MRDVQPRFKDASNCGCTDERCPREGVLTQRSFKDQTRHIRKCPCRMCLGRKSRRTGLDAQRRAAKSLGVPMVGAMRPGNEEQYGGLIRMEAKSGAQVKPLFTAYLKAEAQSEASRAVGDSRPFVMAAKVQPQSKDGLILIRESMLTAVVYALAIQLGLLDDGGNAT